MSKFFPQEILDSILNKVDIVEVVSSYLPLKRAGRNFKANCPFHQEKTPSFMVSPNRQIFHCFGCNVGGNAFNFLMKYEHMDFPEAVEILAKKTGVRLPEEKQDYKVTSINQQIYKVMELAEVFYRNNLSQSSAARVYLSKRKLKDETINLFKIGFAPQRWDSLMNYLRAKNISLSVLEKAGLIISRAGGGYYDRFRNRIIFPVFDIKSKIIAFGGRILPQATSDKDNDDLAKYVNSPETPIYIKGRHLYNLNNALNSIRQSDFVVIVEGYLDCVLPYQEGLQNIVASLGTALTYEQVRLLKRYTHNVVMVYDADAAGEIATLRSLDIFVEEGVNVRIASLPAGFDPDLFVRKNGIALFKQLIKSGSTLFDYKLNILKSRYDIKQIESKALIATEMLVTIKKITNEILKSSYIKRLSEELDVSEEALRLEIKKINDYRPLVPALRHGSRGSPAINPTERLLIKLMLEEANTLQSLRNQIEPADFQDARTSRIVSIMFDLIAQGVIINSSTLINHLDSRQDLATLISELSLMPEINDEERKKIIDGCVFRLKQQRAKSQLELLRKEIKNAQNLKDEELLRNLMREFHSLSKNAERDHCIYKNRSFTYRGDEK